MHAWLTTNAWNCSLRKVKCLLWGSKHCTTPPPPQHLCFRDSFIIWPSFLGYDPSSFFSHQLTVQVYPSKCFFCRYSSLPFKVTILSPLIISVLDWGMAIQLPARKGKIRTLITLNLFISFLDRNRTVQGEQYFLPGFILSNTGHNYSDQSWWWTPAIRNGHVKYLV